MALPNGKCGVAQKAFLQQVEIRLFLPVFLCVLHKTEHKPFYPLDKWEQYHDCRQSENCI